MKDYEKERLQREFRTLINKNIQTIVRTALYGHFTSSKQAFKTKISLQELVDQKLGSRKGYPENELFQKFVTICDDIVFSVKLMFPCVNLEGLDLSWTTEEIQTQVWKMLDAAPEVTLEDCPKEPLEKPKRESRKVSEEQKELEKQLEAFMRNYFGMPAKGGEFKRSWYLSEFVDKLVIDETQKQMQLTNITNQYNNSNKRYESKFIDAFVIEFPKVKNPYISPTCSFTDLMTILKKAYL